MQTPMRCVLLLSLLLLPTWACAAGATTIEAKRFELHHGKRMAIFSGNVHLVREDFELYCDRLVAWYRQDVGHFDRAEASGHVRMRQGETVGEAEQAIFDQKKGEVVLLGNARITQAQGRVSGDKVVHNIERNTTRIAPESGRATLHIDQPEQLRRPAAGGK